jgi:septal ring factor EnvC (AmiA/AmiB activator)
MKVPAVGLNAAELTDEIKRTEAMLAQIEKEQTEMSSILQEKKARVDSLKDALIKMNDNSVSSTDEYTKVSGDNSDDNLTREISRSF